MHMSWWFDNSEANRFNPDPSQDVVYGPETTDEMANARIYYAPTTPRGLVVGEQIRRHHQQGTGGRHDSQRKSRSFLIQLRMISHG